MQDSRSDMRLFLSQAQRAILIVIPVACCPKQKYGVVRTRAKARCGLKPATTATLIVAIDESSLERIGAWPWSRDKLARLIERVETGNPRAIAVDVLLDEKKSEEEDNALAQSIANAPAIVLSTRIASVNGVDRWRRPNVRFGQNHVRLGHVQADPDFDGISRRIFS